MREYETLLLCDARRQDDEIKKAIDAFASLVAERGGAVKNVDSWGRRKLAYEIDDQLEGYYAVMTYDLDPGKRADLEGALPFVDGLVRTKTVVPGLRKRELAK